MKMQPRVITASPSEVAPVVDTFVTRQAPNAAWNPQRPVQPGAMIEASAPQLAVDEYIRLRQRQQAERDALNPRGQYVHQAFPKWVYRVSDGQSLLILDEERFRRLDLSKWVETPPRARSVCEVTSSYNYEATS